MPNRLAHEPSRYLQQHAENPVDWYPWGDEAFEVARETNRPVLLSIGYSACHWCHVMAHESFEDPDTAAVMNERFVNVKVDREERPDVDDLYMQATLALSGHGGWPMTVWLTPDRRPFYAGTYFPPTARGGLPGFAELCVTIADAYADRGDEVSAQADAVTERIRQASRRNADPGELTPALVDEAVLGLARAFDPANGGFGGAPKFPPSVALPFMLDRLSHGPRSRHLGEMVDLTLTRMADGGIHDQVGGGFHRYSVDQTWVVPHFEKMLYDNALLARAYTLAHVRGGDPRWRAVAERTLDFMLVEMMAGDGFAAAFDADSEGGEGAYFVWTPAQLDELLPEPQARAVRLRYGVGDDGNFAGGRTVLTVVRPMEAVTAELGAPAEPVLEAALAAMREARNDRPAPARDDKIIVSWNGLAIAAMAEAALAFGRYDYLAAAEDAARLMMTTAVGEGRLHRTIQDGVPRHVGQLDDHANLAHGLLRLYSATFKPMYLLAARGLAAGIVRRFHDSEAGGFFSTPDDGEALLARTRDVEDHPSPSGNSQAALVLLEVAAFTGDTAMREIAARAVGIVQSDMVRFPHAFGAALQAADRLTRPAIEIAVVGPRDDERTLALLRAARMAPPGAVLAHAAPDDDAVGEQIPLLAGRAMVDGAPAAYVCSNHACRAPVTTPEALADALRG